MASAIRKKYLMIPPGTKIGKYIIARHLGQGSYGTVYEATDSLLGRICALKFVQNQDPAQFVAHYEAQILHKVRHPRIVTVHSVDVIALNGAPFAMIDMEYCAGGSIDKLIKSEFISVRKAVRVLVDVLFALDHAVRQGILHRDIKPANIMVVEENYKLSDFGIAKTLLIGSGKGTPVYSAPEVYNKNETSVCSEIFSAGMTLFQLCNNYEDLGYWIKDLRPIIEGKVISEIGYRPYVPRRIRTICNRACAVDPARAKSATLPAGASSPRASACQSSRATARDAAGTPDSSRVEQKDIGAPRS
jgi:serine/threonine-protein kinase